MQTPSITGPTVPSTQQSDAALRKVSKELEASFLAEMLKTAGLGRQENSFSGGAGEDQFASFLVQAQADAMVQGGGIGLSESIYNALKERQNDGRS